MDKRSLQPNTDQEESYLTVEAIDEQPKTVLRR
jgi:hypothetical protein